MNFHKSVLLGLNLHRSYMKSLADFLECDSIRILLNYLGINVEINQRKLRFMEISGG